MQTSTQNVQEVGHPVRLAQKAHRLQKILELQLRLQRRNN